jgi:hypothetical protein
MQSDLDSLGSLFAELGRNTGIEGLALDDEGCLVMVLDKVTVNMEYDETTSSLFMYAQVGEVPTDQRAKAFEILMDANYLFKDTGGGTFGADPYNGQVVYAVKAPVAILDYPRLETMLGNFADMATIWMERLQSLGAGGLQDVSHTAMPGLRP